MLSESKTGPPRPATGYGYLPPGHKAPWLQAPSAWGVKAAPVRGLEQLSFPASFAGKVETKAINES